MSKRKRTDYEDGLVAATSSNYSAQLAAAASAMTYDDSPSPLGASAVNTTSDPIPALTTPAPTAPPPTTSSASAGRRQISYADSFSSAAPTGPYSYVAEKRQQIYHSGNDRDDAEGGGAGHKRPRQEQRRNRPVVDQRFGQMGAFPEPVGRGEGDGAENVGGDGGAENGDVNRDGIEGEGGVESRDAWEYLRQVREEAQGLPGVLHAGSSKWEGPEGEVAGDTDGYGQEAGQTEQDAAWNGYEEDWEEDGLYYEDGVCYAAPEISGPEKAITAQDLYYQALCRRFEAHQQKIQALLPNQTVKPASHTDDATGLPHLLSSKDLFKSRNHRGGRPSLFGHAGPTLHMIARSDNKDVLKVITVLDEDIDEAINKQENLPARFGAWTWFLLGRLGDKGGLTSEEIVVVRDLAKRAGWALAALKIGVIQREAAAAVRACEDPAEQITKRAASDGLKKTTTVDVEGGEVDAKVVSGDTTADVEEVPNQTTMATLHTIITIAGEFYGQRDLLDSRLPWFD
ncbi:hypothetical protein BDZ85DRAFT_318344 [Elsinoe ampelina]|uniref:Uncharacterized protein n=1 Tax=Elsinoe ampelina TaxID=302913 RepID=A0A6A6GFA4_9PEZI|nr:hypothetical protein BDZ85DRAFT_318344 [Elsinoe ampelina]